MISPSALAIGMARPRGAGEDDVAHAVAASGHSEALCENPTCCLGHAVVNVLVPESANPYEVHAPWYTVPTRCPCHLLADTAGKRRAAADPSFVLRVCNATPFASLGAGASAAASSDHVNAGCVQGAGCIGAHFVDHPAAESIARTISQLRSSFMTVRSLEARFNAIAPSIASSVLLRTAIPALNEPSVAAQLASSAEPRAAAAPVPTSITIPPAPVVIAKPIMSPLPPKPVEPSLAQQLEAEREKLRQAQATLETERRQLADHRKRLDEDRARFEAEKAARAGAGSYVCAICCTSKPRQEGCQCSVCQATVCGECLSSYLLENWTKSENFALNLTATELPSVPCVQCEGQGFDSIAVLETVNRNARRFYLNVARRLSEARGFGEAHVVLEQVLVDLVDRGVLHKMPAVPTKLLDEQFKRQLLNSYMCPRCHFGPITTAGCDDLRRHHEEQVGGAQYDNSCPGCGYLPEVLSDLLVWDGVVRDGRTTRTDSDGGDLPPPVARQVGAHGLSRRILEQFLDMGFSEEVIEEAASQIDDPNNAALLLATLVPE